MSLTAGTQLGPYEILAPLGAGGMGDVYRARDPRMGREVAIKIAVERFSDRLQHEVRAVAALNHPNICQIYDVGADYLVMELVEGLTLSERIRKGAIPFEEALAISRQIALALEAAHAKAIIHRDLKPSNIKIKPDGTVKVLDFGLAKLAEPGAEPRNAEISPTVTIDRTPAGQIVGTAAYMAPEQARGKEVDRRADIWAFGVVFFEMLTGQRLFAGETVSDTLAAVLREEPDWNRVPTEARRLLQRCLEKDPNRRLRDIGDFELLLGETPAVPSSKLPWALAALLALVAALAVWISWRATRPQMTSARAAIRVDLDLGPGISLGSTNGPSAVVSPDGSRLVFVSRGSDGIRRLFTRWLNQPAATELPGTEGANGPFFSPNGEWVGFFAGSKLKKLRIGGGEPISLCDAPAARGASWGEDGNIIAALDTQGGLSLIPQDGGAAVPFLPLGPGEVSQRWPETLPGNRGVLFTFNTQYSIWESAHLGVISSKNHVRKTLLDRGGMNPHYVASGHLVYVYKGILFAAPFDLDRLEIRGPAARLDEVSSDTLLGFAEIAFSRNGTVVFRKGRTLGLSRLNWLNRDGTLQPVSGQPAPYTFPVLSPDGRRLALVMGQETGAGIWIYDLGRDSKLLLTGSAPLSSYPVWSPDARFVVFSAPGGMFWTRADGSIEPRSLTHGNNSQLPTSFSPDGTRLVFSELIPDGGAEIRMLRVSSQSGELRAEASESLFKTSALNAHASVSPDGRWLAYGDTVSGSYEVYVQSLAGRGAGAAARVQVSNAGGVMPVWSRSASELFYRSDDLRIMVVDYSVQGGQFVAGKPRMWCSQQLVNTGLSRSLDIAPDGKRFIVLLPAEKPEPPELQSHVLLGLNYFDEIRWAAAHGN